MREYKFAPVLPDGADKKKISKQEKEKIIKEHVLWANDDFKVPYEEVNPETGEVEEKISPFPFDLSKFFIFVDPNGEMILNTHHDHNRAANFSALSEDKYDNKYFFATVKGLGFIYPENYLAKADNFVGKEEHEGKIPFHITREHDWAHKELGLFDRRISEPLVKTQQELTAAGLRCESIAAVLKLDKVRLRCLNSEGVEEYQTKDIEDLRQYLLGEVQKNSRIINDLEVQWRIEKDIKNFEPVLVVRMLRDNDRIKTFCNPLSRQEEVEIPGDNQENEKVTRRKVMLANCFEGLNLENSMKGRDKRYDINNEESIKEYLRDTFSQAGKNLAIIQREQSMMTFLNSGNITLSLGEIVDLDSRVLIKSNFVHYNRPHEQHQIPTGYVKDIRDELYALGKMLIKSFNGIATIKPSDRENFCKSFLNGYLGIIDDNIDQEVSSLEKFQEIEVYLKDQYNNIKLAGTTTGNNFLKSNEYEDYQQNYENCVNNTDSLLEKTKKLTIDFAKRIIINSEGISPIEFK